MPWTTAVDELRALLSDGPTDRFRFRQRCFGETNGTNLLFKTFEFRRVTNFTTTQGLYKNGVLLALAAVSSDDLATGQFNLATPPIDGDVIEASYYNQWFLDTELANFLTDAMRQLFSGDDYTLMPAGLKPSGLKYAASEAYQKMAQRWREYMSQGYKVEDAPNKAPNSPVDSFIKLSETFRKQALEMRDEFYKRQGRSLQPLFGAVRGNIRSLP